MMIPRRRLLKWVILACLILLVGCQRTTETNRAQLQIDGKQITVLNNPEDTAYDETSIDALVRLDGVRGMDWLSENELIVDKESTDFTPEQADGSKWYPHNLYIHSLLSGAQTPLLPKNENQGFAQLSPDRTKLFYKTFDLQANTGQGYVMDMAQRTTAAFTSKDAMDIQNGRWVNNQSIIYATIEGTIYRVDADNPVPVQLADTQIPFVHNIAFIDDQLYYSSLKGILMFGPPGEKPTILPINNVVWMVPSPDEQRLAIVRRIKSGDMELVITDLQGSILKAVAQDSQIYGTAWSPDGTRLAYAGITPNGTVRGINVADSTTGLSSKLSVDVKFMADPLHWSPTGNRLMVSATQPDEQNSRNQFVTYLIRVGVDTAEVKSDRK